MRILLIGSGGQLGGELRPLLCRLGDVTSPSREQLDLAEPPQIADTVDSVRPEIIINAAAYTAVDRAEQEESRAQAVNSAAPGILSKLAARRDALLVHYSSDYIFDGCKAGPYCESDGACPLSSYGRSKLGGEVAVRAGGARHLILRTSWLYAHAGTNFVNTIVRLAHQRDTLRVVDDQVGAPTWCRPLAHATVAMIRQMALEKVSGVRHGTFHVTAGGDTTWYGFAREIVATHPALAARRGVEVEPITTPQYPTPARRPANSRLSNRRLRKAFGIALPDWRSSLHEYVAAIESRRVHGETQVNAIPSEAK